MSGESYYYCVMKFTEKHSFPLRGKVRGWGNAKNGCHTKPIPTLALPVPHPRPFSRKEKGDSRRKLIVIHLRKAQLEAAAPAAVDAMPAD